MGLSRQQKVPKSSLLHSCAGYHGMLLSREGDLKIYLRARWSFQFSKGFIKRWYLCSSLSGLSKPSLPIFYASLNSSSWCFLSTGCALLEARGWYTALCSALLWGWRALVAQILENLSLKCMFKSQLNQWKLSICLENALLACFWELAQIENVRVKVWLQSSVRFSPF